MNPTLVSTTMGVILGVMTWAVGLTLFSRG